VVLMDIDLGPGRMDGTEAAAEISRRWSVPVVFYSGHIDRETIDRTRRVNRYGYVQKSPGHERYLVATMEMAERLRTAERERERAGQRLQAIFDAADDNILIHLIDASGLPGRYVDVNRSTCETLGYTREELLTMSPLETSIMAEGDGEASAEIMAGILRDGRARFEMTGRRRDGSTIPFEIRAQIVEEDGERLVVGVSRDMTEQYRQRNQMRQTNALLERLFHLRFVNIAILDRSYNYLRVNGGYADSAGRASGELAGLNHFDLYPDPDNRAMFDRVVATGEPHIGRDMPFEFPDQPERGTTYWDTSLYPTFGASGDVDGVILVVAETTRRKRDADRAREMTELYRIVTENVTETVAVYDAAMNVRYISPTSVGQSGWSPAELAGSDVFSLVHPDDAARLECEVADARARGLDEYTNRYRCRGRDGTYAWMESTTRLVRDGSGAVDSIVVASRRIDELMSLTHELERLRELLPSDERARRSLTETSVCFTIRENRGVLRVPSSITRCAPSSRVVCHASTCERRIGYPRLTAPRNGGTSVHAASPGKGGSLP
jgi:PAS domain S-box-containing protein